MIILNRVKIRSGLSKGTELIFLQACDRLGSYTDNHFLQKTFVIGPIGEQLGFSFKPNYELDTYKFFFKTWVDPELKYGQAKFD